MFSKLSLFLNVLKLGNEVADPDKWMKRQADANKLGLLVLAIVGLSKAFGYEFPIDEEMALVLGGAIVSIFNIVLTVISSHETSVFPTIKHDGGSKGTEDSTTEVQSDNQDK